MVQESPSGTTRVLQLLDELQRACVLRVPSPQMRGTPPSPAALLCSSHPSTVAGAPQIVGKNYKYQRNLTPSKAVVKEKLQDLGVEIDAPKAAA